MRFLLVVSVLLFVATLGRSLPTLGKHAVDSDENLGDKHGPSDMFLYEFRKRVNEIRALHGVESLEYNERLMKHAQKKAHRLVKRKRRSDTLGASIDDPDDYATLGEDFIDDDDEDNNENTMLQKKSGDEIVHRRLKLGTLIIHRNSRRKPRPRGRRVANFLYKQAKNYKYYGREPPARRKHKLRLFTQLVWKSTDELGVGIDYVRKSSAYGRKKYTVYIVLEFKPRGNLRHRYRKNVLKPKDDEDEDEDDEFLDETEDEEKKKKKKNDDVDYPEAVDDYPIGGKDDKPSPDDYPNEDDNYPPGEKDKKKPDDIDDEDEVSETLEDLEDEDNSDLDDEEEEKKKKGDDDDDDDNDDNEDPDDGEEKKKGEDDDDDDDNDDNDDEEEGKKKKQDDDDDDDNDDPDNEEDEKKKNDDADDDDHKDDDVDEEKKKKKDCDNKTGDGDDKITIILL